MTQQKRKLTGKSVKSKDVQQVINPQALIQQGVASKASIEVMERLFNLQERWEKNQAKKEFDQAMSNFQAECPIIKRSKDGSKTNAGELVFKYAPLEVIISEVKALLKKYDLSYDFKTVKNEAGKLTDVRCYAKHVAGHSDYSEMPVGEGGGTKLMSSTQINASNVTFAKRYAFCNIFGIVTENEDDETKLANNQLDIESAKKKIDKCKTQLDITKTWATFSKEEKGNAELITYTNKIIANIKNENLQKN